MRMLLLDDETLELVEAAAEMMDAAMKARQRRFPEDHIIHRTASLQRNKMQMVLQARHRPALRVWTELDKDERADVIKLMQTIAAGEDAALAQSAWAALLAIGLGQSTGEPQRALPPKSKAPQI